MKIKEITEKFGITGAAVSSELPGGHINRTFLVTAENSEKYILQQLNTQIFKAPEAVMENISRIERLFAEDQDEKIMIPNFLCTEDKVNYLNQGGEIYRLYTYSEQSCQPDNDWRQVGYSFGAFIRIINSSKLKMNETIKDFHSFPVYFSALAAADGSSEMKKIDKSIMNRLASVRETLSQVFTVDFPKRLVHNDAKYSNVVPGDKYTIIDLDTVMAGYAATDYGDLVRSVIDGNQLDIGTLAELTKGFAEGLDGILTDDEIYSLYYGVIYVTAELAARYLTDYLSDKKYFKGKTSAECLRRANGLLGQLNMYISCGDDITDIIYKSFRKQ